MGIVKLITDLTVKKVKNKEEKKKNQGIVGFLIGLISDSSGGKRGRFYFQTLAT